MKCNLCSTEVTDVCYIELGASIIKQDLTNSEPILFASPAIRSYYNAKIYLHDRCFIKLMGTNTGLKLDDGLHIIPVSQ